MISVIVPVYNGEKFLPRCIQSVINQSYQDWELILIEDGSRDNSAEIIHEYTSADKRIKAIFKKNEGVVRAREDGLQLASGEYITFLDCDDYLAPEALRIFYKKIIDENSDLVIGRYALHWSSNDRIVDIKRKSPQKYDSQSAVSYCLRNGETFLPIKLFRKNIFKRNVKIPRQITYMEDTIGLLQYLTGAEKISYVEESIYYYYKHSDSACYQRDDRHWRSMYEVCLFLKKYLRGLEYGEAFQSVSATMVNIINQLKGYISQQEYNNLISERISVGSGIKDRIEYIICVNHYACPILSNVLDRILIAIGDSKTIARRILTNILR